MGLAVEGGRLGFQAHLMNRGEFLTAARPFRFYDLEGRECCLDLEPRTLAFTTCQVPVVAHQSGPPRIEITPAGASPHTVEGLSLDAWTSAAIFERAGTVRRLDVFFGFK